MKIKVVRMLVYEGEEEAIEKHFSQVFVGPGLMSRSDSRVYGNHGTVEIIEVFRGVERESEVVRFEEDNIPF